MPDTSSGSVCLVGNNPGPYSITLEASDFDADVGDELIFKITSFPMGDLTNGGNTVVLGTISGNQVEYTADTSSPGGLAIDDSFRFTATDKDGLESVETNVFIYTENNCP